MPIPALCIGGSKAIQNCRFRLIQIRQPQDCLRCRTTLLPRVLVSHRFAVLPTANRSCPNSIDGSRVMQEQSEASTYQKWRFSLRVNCSLPPPEIMCCEGAPSDARTAVYNARIECRRCEPSWRDLP